MSGDVVGVDDLVQGKGRLVVIVGGVGVNLRCQDVIVIVKQRQVFHRAWVDLENNCSVRSRWRRLPSRWGEEW